MGYQRRVHGESETVSGKRETFSQSVLKE